jgi:hypothetical protein
MFDGMEFGAGMLAGNNSVGALLFILTAIVVLRWPRASSATALAACLLSVPLYLYLVFPRPFRTLIVLDEFDRELERRGLRFARYADDCNVYLRSRRAGERVVERVKRFIATKLKLKVNEQKSAVARPWERKFLGFSFTANREPKRRIAPKAVLRFKVSLRPRCVSGQERAARVTSRENRRPGFAEPMSAPDSGDELSRLY